MDNTVFRQALDLWFSDEPAAIATYGHISDWNTSNVTDMSYAFYQKQAFNEDLTGWCTGNVINMDAMFYESSFNQPIGNWDVSKVQFFMDMFTNNTVFNQDLSGWDVRGSDPSVYRSYTSSMGHMFWGASALKQDLSSWCVEHLIYEPIKFDNFGCYGQAYPAAICPKWGQPCQ